MSDTPRTDKEEYYAAATSTYVVSVDFARDLERELSRVVEQRQALRDSFEQLKAEVARISSDYIPHRDADAPLALQEMRDALSGLVSAQAGAQDQTSKDETAWHMREDTNQAARSGLAFTHSRSPDA